MSDLMEIENVKAKVTYDPDIEMFRGEFIGLNGGADFYATSVNKLKSEGKKSLRIFLEMCRENGIDPYKQYSGRFNLRIKPELHERIVQKAKADNKSINVWVADTLERAVN